MSMTSRAGAVSMYAKKRHASKSRGPIRRRRMTYFVAPTRVLGGVAGFPAKTRTKLIYNELVSLDPSAGGVIAKNSFTLNGLYDPNITGTGHQPLGFDNFMSIYAAYTVLNASVSAQAVNYATATDSAMLGIYLCDGGQALPTASNTLAEVGSQCHYTLFVAGSIQYNKPPKVQYKNVNIASQLMRAYGDDTLAGNASKNPDMQLYATVFVGTMTATDLGAFNVVVRIEYDVEFHNPIVNQTAN